MRLIRLYRNPLHNSPGELAKFRLIPHGELAKKVIILIYSDLANSPWGINRIST
jgi:hypothetical protein